MIEDRAYYCEETGIYIVIQQSSENDNAADFTFLDEDYSDIDGGVLYVDTDDAYGIAREVANYMSDEEGLEETCNLVDYWQEVDYDNIIDNW